MANLGLRLAAGRCLGSIAAIVVAISLGCSESPGSRSAEQAETERPASDTIGQAFEGRESNVPVEGEGAVTRVLSDDNEGGRHQRFILHLASGQTLLVAHNIDLADRVSPLNVGDRVSFKGVYEWNEKGGVVHWTHRDPHGTHPAGWLKHDGETFQ